MHEYDLIADWYAQRTQDDTGVPEAEALAASLPPNARVLDIGCGHGRPLTNIFLDRGCRVVGLDSSPRMLRHFRQNLPGVPAVLGRIHHAGFADASFEAAYAWGVVFHLTLDEQRAAFANVARILRPGAPFLFTSGDLDVHDDPERGVGQMNGVTFYYYTFSKGDYARILDEHGMTLVETHTDRGDNRYYLARKH